MKIVALSDTHGRHQRVDVPDGDLLLFGGDMGRGHSLEGVRRFNSWLEGLPHEHKCVIAGNCDGIWERDREGAEAELTAATYLQDELLEVEGLRLWGSPWQPVFLDMAFNMTRGPALAEKWRAMPDDLDILLTHGPPRGILDRTSRGQVVGDQALYDRVLEVSPALHVFGHVHESSGVERRDGTVFANVACDRDAKVPRVFNWGQLA